ncbi:Subtilisin-like protease SBT3.5 [Abeliophyllum distichum]|uniref:Subtilisin-like protease SBT3.5 n=1 Tax=Abeliophyllum distichum TaxID=126358 RepID=A0ABD1W1J6_9LAMI
MWQELLLCSSLCIPIGLRLPLSRHSSRQHGQQTLILESQFLQWEIYLKIADPFDYGGGVTNPNGARNPGLVYDMGTQDYINYLCAMGYNETSIKQLAGKNSQCHGINSSILDINFPSITIPNLKGSVTLKRTVTNVGNPNSKYEVIIDPPQGTVVEVKPTYLLFNPKVRTMSYTVTISTSHKITTEYYFGSLTWVDGMHSVRIPITVKTEFPNVFR